MRMSLLRLLNTSTSTSTGGIVFQKMMYKCALVIAVFVLFQTQSIEAVSQVVSGQGSTSQSRTVTSTSTSISFTLINTDTDKTIRPLLISLPKKTTITNVIDVRIDTSGLSIAATVVDENMNSSTTIITATATTATTTTTMATATTTTTTTISYVSFYANDVFVRTEKMTPYSLGGDYNGDYRESYEIMNPKQYCMVQNVTAIAYTDKNQVFATGTVLINVIDNNNCNSTKPISVPVLEPVSKPISKPISLPVSKPISKPISKPVPKPQQQQQAPTVATDVLGYNASPDGSLTGEIRLWHKITIGFHGPPNINEVSIPNPFLDYRLDVSFVHSHYPNRKPILVPGYYAADGNSANTGATSGNVWLVHYSPPLVGIWNWTASFVSGTNVSINRSLPGIPSSKYIHGKKGSFLVLPTNKKYTSYSTSSSTSTSTNQQQQQQQVLYRDFRGLGRLKYSGDHYLQFGGSTSTSTKNNTNYFLKVGADSPENLLAYTDFDNTPNYGGRRKSWWKHIRDFYNSTTSTTTTTTTNNNNNNNPTWNNGKGKGIIGAMNYLSSMGVNSISFLTMNIQGDDENVFPYVTDKNNNVSTDYTRLDVSKLAQWEIVFEHCDHIGIHLHFKTQETENDQLFDNNIGNGIGMERKLYYKELIARFGHHLALNWNIGEENTNTFLQQQLYINYITEFDIYRHPIVIHTYPPDKEKVYSQLLGFKNLTGISMQNSPISTVVSDTREWVTRSSQAGHKWVVACDEQGSAGNGVVPDSVDYYHDNIRSDVLWGNLMNNGGGVEYYFGYQHPNSDLTCEDFRSRENMWKQSNLALIFFHTYLPFWNMSIATSLLLSSSSSSSSTTATGTRTSMNSCLATPDRSIVVIYMPKGGSETIDLSSVGRKTNTKTIIDWYDPELGGTLKKGSISTVQPGPIVSIGTPPYKNKQRYGPVPQDWVVLIRTISI